jgi:hyaluronan synthase
VYTLILQLNDLIQLQTLKFYVIFFGITWGIWLTKIIASMFYKRIEAQYMTNFSVIVPVYKEDPQLFHQVLQSIQSKNPTELIVAVDGGDEQLASIARQYAHQVLVLDRVGKRRAMYEAYQAMVQSPEVVMLVDSDTIWTESTLNILKPFQDPEVGGVSGRHEIFDENKTFSRRVSAWMEDIRFDLVMKAQSVAGVVTCLPGRTIAVRGDLMQQTMESLINDKVFGLDVNTGDDREITTQILKAGFKTVYQDDSVVLTDAPNSFMGFARQQLRWYRSVIRETIRQFFLYLRKAPMVLLWSLEFAFGSVIFLGLIVTALVKGLFGIYEVAPSAAPTYLIENVGLHILLTIIGFFAIYYIRQFPHLIRKPKNFLFLPVFTIYMLIILLPVKFLALFSFLEQSWNTRKGESVDSNASNLFMVRAFGLLFGVVVFALVGPFAYRNDIFPLDIPSSVVFANQAVEYDEARNIILASEGKDARVAGLDTSSEEIEKAIQNMAKIEDVSLSPIEERRAVECVTEYTTVRSDEVDYENPMEVYTTCFEEVQR